jgi:hypothetical protein
LPDFGGGEIDLSFRKNVMFSRGDPNRVARWFIFEPKIPIWVHCGGPWKGKCFIFHDHLEYFMAVLV